jgi:hypothetical protein
VPQPDNVTDNTTAPSAARTSDRLDAHRRLVARGNSGRIYGNMQFEAHQYVLGLHIGAPKIVNHIHAGTATQLEKS